MHKKFRKKCEAETSTSAVQFRLTAEQLLKRKEAFGSQLLFLSDMSAKNFPFRKSRTLQLQIPVHTTSDRNRLDGLCYYLIEMAGPFA